MQCSRGANGTRTIIAWQWRISRPGRSTRYRNLSCLRKRNYEPRPGVGSLRRHWQEIEQRFAIKHLSVFGSAARDELRDDSDIDVLVEFKGKATFDGYMDLKFYLEPLLGRKVDLVTQDAVKPRMRPMIEQEAIHVA